MNLFPGEQWTSQPQIAAPVNPKYRPLYGLQPGGFGLLDTSGQQLTAGSGVSSSIVSAGRSVSFTDDTNGYLRNLAVSASYPLSFVCAGVYGSIALRCISSLATAADKTARVFATSSGALQAQHIGGTTNASAITGAAVSSGSAFVGVAVFASATNVRAYISGNAGKSSASSSTNIGALSTLTRLAYGQYNGSVVLYPWGSSIAIAQWLNVALTDSEAWNLVDNPWQIFTQLPITVWAPSSAAPTSFLPAWARPRSQIIGAGAR